MIESLSLFLWGVGMHQTRRVTARMPNGWGQLSSYAIGIILSLPPLALVFDRFQELGNQTRRFVVVYLVGFSSIGSGVALGWLIDSVLEDR